MPAKSQAKSKPAYDPEACPGFKINPALWAQAVPLADVYPDPENFRLHPDHNISHIGGSVSKYTQLKPIVCRPDGMIVAGNGTYMSAVQAGATHIAAVFAEGLTDAELKEFGIADNATQESSMFDDAALAKHFQEQLSNDPFYNVPGFSDDDIKERVSALEQSLAETSPQAASSPGQEDGEGVQVSDAPCRVQTGQLWRLGTHYLLCGDATVSSDVERVMSAGASVAPRAAVMVTDPPYGVDLAGKMKAMGSILADGSERNTDEIENDTESEIADYRTFFADFLNLAPLDECKVAYVFMSNKELHTMRLALDDAGYDWRDYLCWLKNNHVLGFKHYASKFELIAYAWSTGHKKRFDFATAVLEYARPQKSDLHPSMKPVDLYARLYEDSTDKGAIVYEPFGGSGTAIIAAERTGRRARVIEKSPRYCDVELTRWELETGKKAELVP